MVAKLTMDLVKNEIMAPAWWVRGFEASVHGELSGHGAIEQSLRQRLSPALTPPELDSLLLMFHTFQTQLLSGSDTCSIHLPSHSRHAGSTNRSRLFPFEKTGQLLPSLRLHHRESERQETWPIFDNFSFSGSESNLTIALQPGRRGSEAIFGYSEGWRERIRSLAGESVSGDLIGTEGHLSLWRSLWMETSTYEQFLYLRIEQVTQWWERWLHLDGVFGASLEELFEGINFKAMPGGSRRNYPTEQNQPSSFSNLDLTFKNDRRLRLLARLGQKLISHGLFLANRNRDFLLLDELPQGQAALLWQLAAARRDRQLSQTYSEQISSYYQKALTTDVELLSYFMSGIDRPGEVHSRFLERLKGGLKSWQGRPLPKVLAGSKYAPLSSVAWYFELQVRLDESHCATLPEDLQHSPLKDLLTADNEELAYEDLLKLVNRDLSLQDRLAAADCQSLANGPMTNLDRSRQAHFRSVKALVRARGLHLRLSGGNSAEKLKPDISIAPVGTQTSGLKPRPKGATELAVPQSEATSKVEVYEAATKETDLRQSSKMRRCAAEELDIMRQRRPERYAELRSRYLASLQEAERKLLLDVQRHMEARLFDQHLEQRLIRFMAERPASWQSASGRDRNGTK